MNELNIKSIMDKQQKFDFSTHKEITFVQKGTKILGQEVKETGFIINNRLVTTDSIWKSVEAEGVELRILDSSIISSVHMEGDKYIITVNVYLQRNLIRYFMFQELARILGGEVITNTPQVILELDFEEVDLIALQTYIDNEFDIDVIKESKFFEVKRQDRSFRNWLNKV